MYLEDTDKGVFHSVHRVNDTIYSGGPLINTLSFNWVK